MISVVCVYNDAEMLEGCLRKSLRNQTCEHELILEDNTSGKFTSAAQALNWGGRKAKSKYILFVHQDVDLTGQRWLEEAEHLLDKIPDLGIAGVAGMSAFGKTNRERGKNIIVHGKRAKKWSWGNDISKPEIVQTLDECLIIIAKKVFQDHEFDETTCDGWDLYAVDYCLSIARQGLNAYVIPLSIYHKSKGQLTRRYFQVLVKVIRKHRKNFKYINTTVGRWSTQYPLIIQRIEKKLKIDH
jgi:GT2 family glycosyltransferase